MKKSFLSSLFVLLVFMVPAQSKWVTQTGKAVLYSHTTAEDITAENTTVSGMINFDNGDVVISVPVQGFVFPKALMQEHFNNDRFMDSKKYPRILLKGKLDNLDHLDISKDGTFEVHVTGELTIKGITKTVSEKAHVIVKSGTLTVHSKFVVKDISSFGVGKPMGSRKDNVADNIEVEYTASYEKN